MRLVAAGLDVYKRQMQARTPTTTRGLTVRLRQRSAAVSYTHLDVYKRQVYAELHNGADHEMKGVVSGTAAGVRFEQPVTLAAHEDKTVAFAPEQFPICLLYTSRCV